MDNSTVTLIVAILSSGVLSAVVSGLFQLRQAKQKKDDGVTAGVRQLLYDRIKFLGRSYISKGQVSAEDLEDLIEMHKIYHTDLGGNGFLDSIMDAVKRLPINENIGTK